MCERVSLLTCPSANDKVAGCRCRSAAALSVGCAMRGTWFRSVGMVRTFSGFSRGLSPVESSCQANADFLHLFASTFLQRHRILNMDYTQTKYL